MVLSVNGKAVPTSGQGFLLDLADWNEAVAVQLAAQQGIILTDAHWEIIHFIRAYYQNYKHLPNARLFSKAIANTLGADKSSSHYLHQLFPDGPLKYACKLAGLPKPPTCL